MGRKGPAFLGLKGRPLSKDWCREFLILVHVRESLPSIPFLCSGERYANFEGRVESRLCALCSRTRSRLSHSSLAGAGTRTSSFRRFTGPQLMHLGALSFCFC